MTLATLIVTAAEESGHSNVMLETIGYPIVALCAFAFLAFVTLSYRNVANRHAHKAEAFAKAHENDVRQGGHGH